MAVIPVCTLKRQEMSYRGCEEGKGKLYRLFVRVEFVVEALIRYNRALADKGGTVGVVGTLLEQTVPMLWGMGVLLSVNQRKRSPQWRLPGPWTRRSVD